MSLFESGDNLPKPFLLAHSATTEEVVIEALIDLRHSCKPQEPAETNAIIDGARAKLFRPHSIIAETGFSPPIGAAEYPAIARSHIGRYERIEMISFGGMGIVHRCLDPLLQREVAIKIRRDNRPDNEHAYERLLNEARALGALNHENVVRVYDAGKLESQELYVVLEFVEGLPLTDWLSKPRSTAEILNVFIQAGHGLAAAHEKGILHRDVKPSNIVVRNDGRVKLIDFGIARVFSQSEQELQRDSSDVPELYEVTKDGHISGTRGFLAPELLLGAPPTIASDIFAYCITLYWALFRRNAFARQRHTTGGLQELEDVLGEYHEPTSGESGASWRVTRVLRKGLSPHPEARFNTMHGLLNALTRKSYIRPLLVAGFAAVLTLFQLASWSGQNQSSTMDACGLVATVVWSAGNREDLRRVFEDTGVDYKSTLAETTNEYMGAYSKKWNEDRNTLCTPRADGVPPRHEKVECLTRDAERFETTKELLFRANQNVLSIAPDLLPELFPLPKCENTNDVDDCMSAQDITSDQITRELISNIDQWIDRSRTELLSGNFEEAVRQAKRAVASTRNSHQKTPSTSIAKAYHALGVALYHSGRYSEAFLALSTSNEKAHLSQCGSLLSDSSRYLRKIRSLDELSQNLTLPEDVPAPIHPIDETLALAKLSRSDQLLDQVDLITSKRGDNQSDLASDYFNEALTLREQAVGTSHPSMYKPYLSLGSHHARRGDYENAAFALGKALGLARGFSANRESAQILATLAQVEVSQGDITGALSYAEETVRFTVELHDDEFLPLRSLHSMAEIFLANREHEEAARLFGRVLTRLDKKRVEVDTRFRASVLVRLAEISQVQRNLDDGLAYANEAISNLLEPPRPHDELLARANLIVAESTLDLAKSKATTAGNSERKEWGRVQRILLQAIDTWDRNEDFVEHVARARWALARVLCEGYGDYRGGRLAAEMALHSLQGQSSSWIERNIESQMSTVCSPSE